MPTFTRHRHRTSTPPHPLHLHAALLRPPDKTFREKVRDFFWDRTAKTCLTRTPINWLAISVYYFLFLAVIGIIFYVTMLLSETLATSDEYGPEYILDDSWIGTSPSINYFPLKGSLNLLWLSSSVDYNEYVSKIDKEFDSYKKKNSSFDPGKFGACGNAPYGYDEKKPCIYFRLNRILQWKPEPFQKDDTFPDDMPSSVKDMISKSETPKIWVSCSGASPKDRDHITDDFFQVQGDSGFDLSAFPFKNDKGYLDSIIAVKFHDPEPKKILYTFTCTAWAHKVDRKRSKVEGERQSERNKREMSGVSSNRKKQRVLSETEKKILKEAFELFDSNNDGYLDYYEFKASSRCLGFHLKKPELLSILETYARFNKNMISYEDFYEVMEEKMVKRDPLDEIKEAFKLIANDKTNVITFRDLKLAAEKIGADIPDRDLRSMIEEFDTKGEGKLDEEDFINLITGESL